MIVKEVLPCLALQPFIRNHLLVHFESLPELFRLKPYPARIEQSLNFFVRGHITNHNPVTGKVDKIAPNAIFGQQVSRLNFNTCPNPEFLMLMVVFQPAAMYRFLGLPSNELTTEFCEAEALWGAELRAVNDQIANAKNYNEIIVRAEEYLLRKLKTIKKEEHPIDKIGHILLHNPNPFSLDWLANQACLSPRQFERKFSERMGVGPKLYSRMSRFFQAFNYKEANQHLDWLSIAVQFGYTDYYHLVKDFKQFANVTPNLLLRENAHRPEIVVSL